jgi:hypothetical protein
MVNKMNCGSDYREGQEDQLSSLQLEICLGRSKRVL